MHGSDEGTGQAQSTHETARDICALVQHRIARQKQNRIAEALGMSRSAVNHIVTGETGITLERLGEFLEALGLRVVDVKDVTIPANELEALRLFAERGIRGRV